MLFAFKFEQMSSSHGLTYEVQPQANFVPNVRIPFRRLNQPNCENPKKISQETSLGFQIQLSKVPALDFANRRVAKLLPGDQLNKRKRIRKRPTARLAALDEQLTSAQAITIPSALPTPTEQFHKNSVFFSQKEEMMMIEETTAAGDRSNNSLSSPKNNFPKDFLSSRMEQAKAQSVFDKIVSVKEKRFSDEFVDSLISNCEANRFLTKTSRNNFCSAQKEINEKMRAVLINWLLSVHHKFQFRNQTFFIAVSLIDLYTSQRSIARKQYQLLGIAALFVAAKFEEIFPPKLSSYLTICDNFCTREEIVLMEGELLTLIDYQVPMHTTLQLIDLLAYRFDLPPSVTHIAHSLAFAALFDLRAADYGAEKLARTCLYLGLRVVNKKLQEKGAPIPADHSDLEAKICGKNPAEDLDPRVVKFMGFLVKNLEKAKLFAIHKLFPFFKNLAESKEDQPRNYN